MTAKNELVIQGEVVGDAELAAVGELTPALKKVVTRIDRLFAEAQAMNIQTFWHVGRMIAEVRDDPDKYLTKAQQASHVDGEAVIMAIFAPVYSAEQLRTAVLFFERYPSETELNRLLEMRCPDRPRWRLTASHVQLLAQISDDEQRSAVEHLCAEEAYTARALAQELQERVGKKRPGAGRTHEAPRGLKQQLLDLLTHQRRFIGRSEQLWLNEESDNIYDDIANESPTKLTATVLGYWQEIEENFSRLSDLVADHVAMCRKIRSEIIDPLYEAADAEDDPAPEAKSGGAAKKSRTPITR